MTRIALRQLLRETIGAALRPHGFELTEGTRLQRVSDARVIQELEVVRSRSRDGRHSILSMFLGTRVEAYAHLPGDFGPGLDWTFTMNALAARPTISGELEFSGDQGPALVEAWLRSMQREVEDVGMEFFDQTNSLERLVDFAQSEFCRTRSASYSELFASLRRAMLLKLLGRTEAFEAEIGQATSTCPSRLASELQGFIQELREAD